MILSCIGNPWAASQLPGGVFVHEVADWLPPHAFPFPFAVHTS